MPSSFPIADSYNIHQRPDALVVGATVEPRTTTRSAGDPLTYDTAYYGDYASDPNQSGRHRGSTTGGAGLPFAYDPLWRFQTPGGSGSPDGLLPRRPVRGPVRLGARLHPQRHLGRRHCPAPTACSGSPTSIGRSGSTATVNDHAGHAPASCVPNIFVSPEDVVWQNRATNTYTVDGVEPRDPVGLPSPIVPT